MAVKQVVLKLDDRIKQDFFKKVPDVSAFLRQCVLEVTYGSDTSTWPFYAGQTLRGRPVKVYTPVEPIPVKEVEIPKNIVDTVFGRHLSPSVGSMLDNPPEGIIGEGANEGYGVGEDAPKLTLDEMIEAIKNETRKETDNDTART